MLQRSKGEPETTQPESLFRSRELMARSRLMGAFFAEASTAGTWTFCSQRMALIMNACSMKPPYVHSQPARFSTKRRYEKRNLMWSI